MIGTENKNSAVTVVARHADGSVAQHVFESDGGVFVGRSSNCGLRLKGNGLSDIHCRIELIDGDAWVQDWMSKQGTMVDDTRIETKTLLEPGSILSIGDFSISIQSEDDVSKSGPDSVTEEPSAPDPDPAIDPEMPLAIANRDELGVETPLVDESPSAGHANVDGDPISFDYEADFFDEETYDKETVDLLRAEIADLQAALAQKDSDHAAEPTHVDLASETGTSSEPSDALMARMEELIDEAQRSDERVALLEEMLHASEEASRNELEERGQLEGWVGEIERRIGQREQEHAAEIEMMSKRVEEAVAQRDKMQQRLHQTASHGASPKHYEETLESLQRQNKQLQQRLDESEKQVASLSNHLRQAQEEQNEALREERATIAQERAKISRLRFELSNRLTGLEELPKAQNDADRETALRLQTLRQHLREIHEEEKREAKQASLATRVKKLWNRVEY